LDNVFGQSGGLEAIRDMQCQFGTGDPSIELFFHFDEKDRPLLREILKTQSKMKAGRLRVQCSPQKAIMLWGNDQRSSRELTPARFNDVRSRLLRTPFLKTPIDPVRSSNPIRDLLASQEYTEAKLLEIGGLREEQLNFIKTGRNEGHIALGKAGDELSRQLRKEWTQDQSIALDLVPSGSPPDERYIEFRVRDRFGATVPLDARGDGFRWFLSFFAALRLITPKDDTLTEIVLFDEPGVHLHPRAQSDLCRLFNEDLVAGANRQVLYTTHSPFMLEWSRPHQVRVLEIGETSGTTIVNKPYHSDQPLNFWEPFRRNIGLFLGDLGLLGEKNLLVEGAIDQILLSHISREAKVQGLEHHLDLGERRIIPYGNSEALAFLVGTCKAYRRQVIVLVDSDNAGKQVADRLERLGHESVPVVTLAEFLDSPYHLKEISIEDAFEKQYYLDHVNEFYSRFAWYKNIDLENLGTDRSIAVELNKYFTSKFSKEFSKADIGIFIASSSSRIDFERMQLIFPLLCRRIENPVGVLELIIVKPPSGSGLPKEKSAACFNLVVGRNLGVKKLEVRGSKKDGDLIRSWVFPPNTDSTEMALWDVWEKQFIATDVDAFLTRGSARILVVDDDALRKIEVIEVDVELTDGSVEKYEALFTQGDAFKTARGEAAKNPWVEFAAQHAPGTEVEGVVEKLSHFSPAGFYVGFPGKYEGIRGFVHISAISRSKWIHDVSHVVVVGDFVKVRIVRINPQLRTMELSMIDVEQQSEKSA
jgi:predicted RNA-binding protein with RPS1 domain